VAWASRPRVSSSVSSLSRFPPTAGEEEEEEEEEETTPEGKMPSGRKGGTPSPRTNGEGLGFSMHEMFWLVPVGFVVGTFGTLIGAGGGFILMPLLLLVYPTHDANALTAVSLGVVCLNATSGSISYARMRLIDYRPGLLFAAAGLPGALLGAYTTDFIPRRLFDGVFGVLLVASATFLFLQAQEVARAKREGSLDVAQPHPHKHGGRYYLALGTVLSFFVGYLSSLLGIGGGIIHVPVLVALLNFPVHRATATSHFILAILAFAGTCVHVAAGNFAGFEWRTIYLGAGVVVGAQLGARLSKRVGGKWIIRGLSGALVAVGIRILIKAF
jgi:uncharacterized membrane protein YfcA